MTNSNALKIILAGFALFFCGGLTSGLACAQYKTLAISELKEYRDKLIEEAADPIDRLFAYQQLSCSDQPGVRRYAIDIGMQNATDDIVRHAILLDAVMALPRIDLEIPDNQDADDAHRKFLTEKGNVLSFVVRYRDKKAGCLSFFSETECSTGRMATLLGRSLSISNDDIHATLTLTTSGEMTGFLRRHNLVLPTKMKLF